MRRTTLALLAACLLPTGPVALGQDGSSGAGRQTVTAADDQSLDRFYGPTIDTNFDGGTMAAYIEAVKRAAGERAPTVMVRGNAEAVMVGPVELRRIPMVGALQLLDGVHDGGDRTHAFHVQTKNVGAGAGGDAAFLVNIESLGRAANQMPRDFRVLPIREITEALPGDPPEIVLPAETVLTAIETVIDITDADGGGADIRFHPESGLLMLAGPIKSLDAAETVLERIFGDVERRRDRARDLQRDRGLTDPDVLEDMLNNARAEVEVAAARLQYAKQEHALTREQVEKQQVLAEEGSIPEEVLKQAKLRLLRQEAELREQQIKLERLHQQAEQAEQRLHRSREIVGGGGPGGGELDALRAENAMLRERLAALEAQVTSLNNQLKGRDDRAGSRPSSRGDGR